MVVFVLVLLLASTHGYLLALYPTDNSGIINNGVWSLPANLGVPLQLFGSSPSVGTFMKFTSSPTSCNFEAHSPATISPQANGTATVVVQLPLISGLQYICIDGVHQGTSPAVTLTSYNPPDDSPILPLAAEIVIIFILLIMAGLFSGLNLGVMSLDTTELKIVLSVGSEQEQKWARAIMPLRERGNMLLCTLLLGNVLVNSTLTVFMESVIGSGLFAVVGSSLGIVVFGEIFPQALCSRHALWVGAHTTWLMKFFMVLTAPLSWPISIILDRLLGEELGAVYQRKQLLRLIQLTRENIGLGQGEFDIITGALTYRDKTASQVMTKLEDVYMLDATAVLDYRTLTQITTAGHSRIPVFRGARENVVGLLFVKDLAFVDPEDCTPVDAVVKHYNHALEEVYDDMRLDLLLDFFRQGRTHICLVVKIDSEGEGDPRRVVLGIVTLEDVLEEIIQAEILDEKDGPSEVTAGGVAPARPPPLPQFLRDAAAHTAPHLDAHFEGAVLSHLAGLAPFAAPTIDKRVLQLLVRRRGVLVEIVRDEVALADRVLYMRGAASTVYTLVLEGRVHVTFGSDDLAFDAGPFTSMGLAALRDQQPFVSDITAVVECERVLLLRVTRKQYVAAVNASRRKLSMSQLPHHDSHHDHDHELATPPSTPPAVATTVLDDVVAGRASAGAGASAGGAGVGAPDATMATVLNDSQSSMAAIAAAWAADDAAIEHDETTSLMGGSNA